jgi:Flp pilus assembly protein CpaB
MTYRLRNIAIAVALAVLAAMIVSFYVKQQKQDLQKGQTLTAVYVAKEDIPAGTPGEDLAAKVSRVEVAKDAVAPGAIVKPEDLEGKVSNEQIYANEQVSILRFSSPSEQGIQAKLSGTLRAVQVPGDEHQLLAGTLKDGDKVDVVGNWNLPEADKFHYSRTILRDILVVKAPVTAENAKRLNTDSSEDKFVILALTDAQEQKLFWVAKNGDWSLELRPAKDPADSPQGAETSFTMLVDGLNPSQLRQLNIVLQKALTSRGLR